ncbi:MAG: hypothetical protein AAF624_08640 [Bacteroidota bacterium]
MADFNDDLLDPTPAFEFYRRRTAGETLSDAFEFARLHFRELFGGLLVIVGPFLLMSAIVSARFQMASFGFATTDPDTLDGLVDFYTDLAPMFIFSSLSSLVVYTLMAAATFAFVHLVLDGEAGHITPGVLWAQTRPLLGRLIAISLLSTLIFVLGFALNIIPCLGSLAWLVGAIYLLPVFWLWQAASVYGTRSIGGAFGEVRALVKGSWGGAFGALLLVSIAMVAIGFLIGLPGIIVSFLVGYGSVDPGSMEPLLRVLTVSGTILASLGTFAYALLYLGAALYYFNLVERSEAVGLERRVDDLDDFDSPEAPPAW